MTGVALPYDFVKRLEALPYVQSIYLFGSRARGDHRERSDIDLSIRMRQGSTPEDWLKILAIVEDADTLLTIDCVDLDQVNDNLRQRILSQGKLLYERTDER